MDCCMLINKMTFYYINKNLNYIFDIAYIYWAIECTSKLSFEPLFEVARTIYIYWALECTPKPSFE